MTLTSTAFVCLFVCFWLKIGAESQNGETTSVAFFLVIELLCFRTVLKLSHHSSLFGQFVSLGHVSLNTKGHGNSFINMKTFCHRLRIVRKNEKMSGREAKLRGKL